MYLKDIFSPEGRNCIVSHTLTLGGKDVFILFYEMQISLCLQPQGFLGTAQQFRQWHNSTYLRRICGILYVYAPPHTTKQ